jgi:hypothetical protein
VVQDGISSIRDLRAPSTAATWDTLLDLLSLGARLARQRGEIERADAQLAQAERIASRLDRPLDALGAQLLRIQFHGAGGKAPPDADAVRALAARRFLALGDAMLREHPGVVRSAAQALGGEDGDVLVRAIDLLGISATDLDALAEHIERLRDADSVFGAWLQDYASRRGVTHDPVGVRELLDRLATTNRLGELARALVAQSEPDSEIRRRLIAMLPAATTTVKGFP